MITLGLHSQFTLTEITYVYLPFCTQAGVYLFQLFDWYVGAVSPLFFTLVECTSVAWLFGAERFSRDVEMMIGRRVPGYIRFCWSFLSPLLLIVLMVTSLVSYVPPTYGDYVYPSWAAGVGWVFAMLPIVPVLVTSLSVVYYSSGKTFYQKLRQSVRLTEDWKPAVGRVDYIALSWEIRGTFTQRLLVNLGITKQTDVL